ncbi:MFS general substrate transporter [Triangularia verruculosa]|uniref:MFS general substrate transporter n=1 Tax=Triangularia verruculosa TaxID=2587418 RepID=A0AAN6XR56_9PEZI|nr:MFS general substrate transporter [Triangularia verruculosa]
MATRHADPETQPLLAVPANVVDGENGGAAEAENVHVQSELRANLKFIFPALAIGIFLAAGDQTIIISSYGRIGSDLNELDKTAWLATAYLCTTTSFQPLYGKLGDIFGRKACLLFAFSVFGLGALLCGLAGDMTQLIAARALTGVGAGGIITVVSILLSDIVTLEERGVWQSYVNMVFALGAGLGAPLGGVLTDAIGWRWAFIVQAPLIAVAIVLVFVLLPPGVVSEDESTTAKLAQVDFLGAAALIAFLVTLLVFLDRISAAGAGWDSYLWLLASAISLAAFLFIEQKVASNPLTPLRLLFGKDFLGAYLGLAFGNVAWYGVLFYVPLVYQVVSHFSPSLSGTLLLPGISSGIIGGFVGGAVLKRKKGTGFRGLALGSYPLVTAACLGVAVGAGLFHTGASMATIIVVMSTALFIGGLGNGAGMTATLVVVVAVAAPEDQAVVTACVYLYRQLGATVGLALISMVFRRALTENLVRKLVGVDVDEIVRRVSESLDYLPHLPAETRKVVENAYGSACQAALLVCTGLAVCAIVYSCFIREKRRDR